MCSFHALPAATLGYQELQGCTVVQLLCSHCTSCTGMCAASVCIKCSAVLCSWKPRTTVLCYFAASPHCVCTACALQLHHSAASCRGLGCYCICSTVFVALLALQLFRCSFQCCVACTVFGAAHSMLYKPIYTVQHKKTIYTVQHDFSILKEVPECTLTALLHCLHRTFL